MCLNFDSFDVLIGGGREELSKFAKNRLRDRWEDISIGTWGCVPLSWGGNFDTQDVTIRGGGEELGMNPSEFAMNRLSNRWASNVDF